MVNKNPLFARHLDHIWLREQYLEYERSVHDIAKECGVSAVAVSKALQRFGIPARPFQGRQQPGAPSETQKRITEKIVRHAPLALSVTPTAEDFRNPPLRPQAPDPNSQLMLRIDHDWLDPHAHWLMVSTPTATFRELAIVILAVAGQPFGTELAHFVVPEEGRPPRRTRGPFWRPTINDVIVPIVVNGDENYGDQLVGSDDTPLSTAVGKGWIFWFHWNYSSNTTFTVRVVEEINDEELLSEDDIFKLLVAPKKLPVGNPANKISLDPIDVSMRVTRALQW
jgi:hypothetical protein